MKINRLFEGKTQFIRTGFIGIVLFVIFSFSPVRGFCQPGATNIQEIQPTDAIRLYQGYQKIAYQFKKNEKAKGIKVDSVLIEGLKYALMKNPTCHLRIVPGFDETPNHQQTFGLIVPVDPETGRDLKDRPVIRVVCPSISLCPNICDSGSPYSK
jgi:hypothetical protein